MAWLRSCSQPSLQFTKKTTLLPYSSVEGLTNSHDIAGKFADMFEAVSQPNIISVNAYHESTFNGRF